MPYNPGGVFSLVASYFANPGTTIRTEQHNPVFEDVGSALSQVVLRDGRAPMTGALNMNGFPINNVVAGNTSSSVATLAQAVPIGAVTDFAGVTAPAGWMLCNGQAISRSTYATLFAIVSVLYGTGDGSTTFNLPDLRGRVSAGPDGGAGRLTSTYMGNPPTIAVSGGGESRTMGVGNLPPYTPTGSVINVNVTSNRNDYIVGGVATTGLNNGIFSIQHLNGGSFAGGVGSTGFGQFVGDAQGGSSAPFGVVQPTLILNKIIKVSYDG